MITRSFKHSARKVVPPLRHRRAVDRGFALVSTLMVMMLVVLLAVGMLSLSAISLRASSQGLAMAKARANARMAMMLAIGQIQRDVGSDMRVTASADILDRDLDGDGVVDLSNLAVTGVWKSWEGSDHTATGTAAARPIAPGYGSKRIPASSANGRFLSWLVSKPQNVSEDGLIGDAAGWSVSDALQDIVRNTPFEGSVPLVSIGTLAAGDPRQVHVAPVMTKVDANRQGAYAWWVAGENQKARLPVPYKPANNDDAAAWSVLAKSHATADPSALELDTLLAAEGPAKAAKALSLRTSSLLAGNGLPDPDPARQFHDMSAVSVGLLTNTATGGWRKDLSLFTENWDGLPDSGAEVFRITPSTTAATTKPTAANPQPAGSLFYPWSVHRTKYADGTTNITSSGDAVGASSSWHHLKEYVTSYKTITMPGGDGKPQTPQSNTFSFAATQTMSAAEQISYKFDYLHKVQVVPVAAQTRWVFMHRSTLVPNTTTYGVQLKMLPIITFWNPYNVSMVTKPATLGYPRNMPIALRFWVGDKKSYWYFKMGDNSSQFTPADMLDPAGAWRRFGVEDQFKVPSVTLRPGETKVFYVNGSLPNPSVSWWEAGGNISPVNILSPDVPDGLGSPGGGQLLANANEQVKVEARFDVRYREGIDAVGVSVQFTDSTYGPIWWKNPTWCFNKTKHDPSAVGNFWPPIVKDDLMAVTPQEVATASKPFLSMIFGPRTSMGAGMSAFPSHRYIPSKGILQSTPFVSRNEFGVFGRSGYGNYNGTSHPVNAPFDVSYLAHGSADSTYPNIETNTYRGYICSGITSGTGLTRIVVAELPLRPLCSLAELQHWDACFGKLVPPFQVNIIGNSDAQPLLPPDNVVNALVSCKILIVG